jgi:membrane protein DedA with SNARE-associated domain
MDPAKFVVYTAVGTVAFYAATGTVVYYGRQQPLIAAALDFAADRPALTAVAPLALLVIGIRLRRRSRRIPWL